MYTIYQIKHKTLPLTYIGMTSDFKKRMHVHNHRLNDDTRNERLYHTMRHFGADSFVVEVVDWAKTKENAKAIEQQHITSKKANLNEHFFKVNDYDFYKMLFEM